MNNILNLQKGNKESGSMALLSMLAIVIISYSSLAGAAVLVQGGGDDFLAFQGEDADSITNPDAANDVQNSSTTGSAESPTRIWEVVSDGSALDGNALEAPPSPHKQQTSGGPQESIAVYQLQFATAGTYNIYLKARNNGVNGNGSSDSMWLPATFGAVTPDVNRTIPNSGSYEWITNTSTTYTVSGGDVGNTLTFQIGVRENDARVDAIVFSTDGSLTDTELDGLFGGGPPPPADCIVTTVSELHSELANASPGKKIIMQDGVWNNANIIFNGQDSLNGTGGTASDPIILQAQTLGGVSLEGNSRIRIAGEYMIVDGLTFQNGSSTGNDVIEFRDGSSNLASNCRLTNTSMINYNPADPNDDYKWVSVYGLNNRVDHCYFSGMNHAGVQLTIWLGTGAPANNTQIDYNYFGDRAAGTGNGFETIRIGTSTRSNQDSNAIVENNYFYRCDGEIEIISNKSVGNIYRYNTFVECDGQLTLRHGSACTVEGNFFFGGGVSGSSGVRIIGPDHVVTNNYFQDLNGDGFRAALTMMNGVPSSPLNRYLPVENALVAFNTFVNCDEVFAIGEESSLGDTTVVPDMCTIANNVVQGSSGNNITYTNTPTNFTYEGNIMFGTLGISPTPSGISTADPDLVFVGADGLYRPDETAPASPAIDGAVGTYTSVTDDMEGHARGATKDVGADEVSSAMAPRGPLTPADVGPTTLVPVEISSFFLE